MRPPWSIIGRTAGAPRRRRPVNPTLDRPLPMPIALPKSFPRRVFLVFMAITALGIAAAIVVTVVTGWVPPRGSATVVLPLYFAVLLLALSAAFVSSGDTLMHHHATGTIQRATSPVEFWSVVAVQVVLAFVLLVFAAFKWRGIYGSAL
jgi:hypothetical protein